MTDEQLDEIETLRLAATGGKWQHQRWPCQIWEGDGPEAEMCAAIGPIYAKAEQPNREQVYADAKFMEAMSEYALPLVNALREARSALDEREGDMHDRIRAGYDKTVADSWRAHCAKVVEERDEARAEAERLKKRLESEQHFIDAVCHYRNLAIVLGAKPEQMLGKFDRELCESGIDPDETSSGYHVSVNQELDTLKDVWAEVERLQAMLKDAILERDEALADLSTSRRANGRIIKERDEARAYKDQWQRAAEEERAKVRAEFEEWKRGHLNHEADDLRAERDEARAEVERLREAARQVHALAEKGTRDWPGHTAFYALTDIHKITKGMVE